MKARLCIAGVWVWFMIVIVTWLVICPSSASSFTQNPDISLGPVVSGTTQNSTFISIIARNDCNPVIRYANDSYLLISHVYDHEISSTSYDRNHMIQIADLEPATKYHYIVRGCGVQEIDRTFSTYPSTGSCTFIVYGDTREQAPLYNQTERHKLVADRIAQEQDAMFVVNSGDLVSNGSDMMEWSRFFDATEKVRSMTTYIAIPGNHDTNRILFRQLFGTDKTTFVDCGGTRIALLDSTDLSSMTLENQAMWLKSSLLNYQGVKVVILHYPVYSSDEKHYGGWQNIQETLVPAFKDSGVQLVFNSHVHAFEQVERDGITYITEARGGAPFYPLNTTRIPGSVRAFENTLGYSRVTVDPEAGLVRIDVIKTADVSGDLRTVTMVYPEETFDARIRISTGKHLNRFTDIFELMCFLKYTKDADSCNPPNQNVATLLP